MGVKCPLIRRGRYQVTPIRNIWRSDRPNYWPSDVPFKSPKDSRGLCKIIFYMRCPSYTIYALVRQLKGLCPLIPRGQRDQITGLQIFLSNHQETRAIFKVISFIICTVEIILSCLKQSTTSKERRVRINNRPNIRYF